MSNIAEQICEAVDVIVLKRLADAGYDKTIQATIVSCLDSVIGKYRVKYQNSYIIAYAANPSIKYQADSLVYILIPGNDMSKDKVIMSSVDKSIFNYTNTVTDDNRYQTISGNLALPNANEELKINGLRSYVNPDGQAIYNKDDENSSSLIVYNQELVNSLIEGGYLKVKLTVQTSLPLSQQVRGQYGLSFILEYNNGTTETLNCSSFNMTGNPYGYINKQEQIVYLEVKNVKNLKSIQSINTYSKDFPYSKDPSVEEVNEDIWIENIELYGAKLLTEEELKGVRLELSCNGTTLIKKDESYIPSNFTLTAIMKVNGMETENTIECYWFKENLLVTDTHEKYNALGGIGWEYLGQSLKDYSFYYTDLTATKNTYKCVARFVGENALYEATQVITNEAMPEVINKKVIITSTDGTIFYNGQGKPTLQVNLEGASSDVTYYYIWKIKNNNGESKIYYSGSSDAMIESWINNKDITIFSAAIDDFADFECYVYDSNEDLFNSATIQLTNTMESSSSYFNIAVQNGNQIFIYNKYNLSPTHKSLKFPQEIYPLSFIFTDDSGARIPLSKILALDEEGQPYGKVRWLIPTSKTLIKVNSSIIDGNYYVVENVDTLSFTIVDNYDIEYGNNTIILEIEYQDVVTRKDIDLTFIKDNDMIDNGTDTVIKEKYNYGDNVLLSYINDNSKAMYYKNNHNDYYCSKSMVMIGEDIDLFSIEMWKNHNQLTLSNSITWTCLPSSNDVIVTNNGKLHISGNRLDGTSPTCIARAKTTFKNNIYYLDIPVITINMNTSEYQIALKPNTGFQKVRYDRNGKNPSYDNSKPFEILVGKSDTYETQSTSLFTYTWNILGDKTGLFIVNDSSLSDNQKRISPIDTWLGDIFNSAILVTVYKDGTKIGDIHIPVAMYLDRKDTESLREWDGNYITNGDEKFLTPIGYGSISNENGFNGIFLGRVQSDSKLEQGLFSYSAGTRILSADDSGSIYIGPKSNAYIGATAAGLEIKYINDNFALDTDGILQKMTLGSEVVISGENISDDIPFDNADATGLGKVLYNLKLSIDNSSSEGFEDIQQNYVTKLISNQTVEDLRKEQEDSINEVNQKLSDYVLTEDILNLLGITDITSTLISPSSVVIGTNLIVDDSEDTGLQTVKVTANDYLYNQENIETGEIEVLSLLNRIAALEAEVAALKNETEGDTETEEPNPEG